MKQEIIEEILDRSLKLQMSNKFKSKRRSSVEQTQEIQRLSLNVLPDIF